MQNKLFTFFCDFQIKDGLYVEEFSEYASIKYTRMNVQGWQISYLFSLTTFTPEDDQQLDGPCVLIKSTIVW